MLIVLLGLVVLLIGVLVWREPELRRWLTTVALRREGTVRAALGRFQPRDIQRQALALTKEKALVSIGYAHLPTDITVLLNPEDLERLGAARDHICTELAAHVAELDGGSAGGEVIFLLAAKPHVELDADRSIQPGTVGIAVAWLEGTSALTALLPTEHASTDQGDAPRVAITVDDTEPVEVALSGRMAIGRAPTSAIPINHPSISRNHAVLAVDDDSAVTITDLGSRNGVEVPRVGRLEPDTPVRISTGEALHLGRHVRLELLAGPTQAHRPSWEDTGAT
jgi:hypothetical protein